MMKAIDVIRIGRKRMRQASSAACTVVRPWSSSSRANSTIRIAFFDANPTSTNSAICVKILLSPPVSFTPISAHRIDIGTIRMTASGKVQLSYCAASTRNTSSTHSGNTIIIVLPARISWNVSSVHSYVIPFGSTSCAIRSIAACA